MIFLVGSSRACHDREETACICLPQGVAVSFLPQIKSCFFFGFFLLPNPVFFFRPTPSPGGSSPNSKAALQTGTDILWKPWAGSSLGLPCKGKEEGERGAHIVDINTKTLGEYMFGPAVQLMLILQLHSVADSAKTPTDISVIPPIG